MEQKINKENEGKQAVWDQDLKEFDASFDYLYKMQYVKDAGHSWIEFTDKWNAFKKKLLSKENEGKPKEGITKEQIIKVMRNSEESLNRNVGMGCNYETYLLPPDYTLVARKILQLIALNEGKQAGDVFVKASERLPDNPNPKQRVFIKNDGRRDVMVYIVDWESKKGNWCWSLAFNDSKGKMISKKEFEKIEWLDENNI